MRGDIPPLPQYAYMAWCTVKAQGLYLVVDVDGKTINSNIQCKDM
jgi:hypothetical protein